MHGDVSPHNRSCLPGGTGPCPHAQLLPRGGPTPARRPLLWHSSPAAGKGLTPSSCSPDAGSGIHICVIINLGESAAAGGWLCPPSLTPHSEAACGCQGAAGEGWQPRCCGILPPDSQGDELETGRGAGPLSTAIPIFPAARPRRAGTSRGSLEGAKPSGSPRAGQHWGVIGFRREG